MKKVAIIQSNYIPWKGYFDIIHDVELFIFLDDVQFTVRDWRTRNKIKTPRGLRWLSVPVGSDRNRLIHEVQIIDDVWYKSHWEMIKENYSKSPYFRHYRGFFENLYMERKWNNLSDLNQHMIQTISKDFLGIRTEFKDSREFLAVGEKTKRLLDILTKAGGDHYLSGPAAKDYIEEEQFKELGIGLHYKDYSGYPEYPQPYPPFEHGVTILDLLFNCGPDSSYFIWGWRELK